MPLNNISNAELLRLYTTRHSRTPLAFSTRHAIQDAVMKDSRKTIGVLGGNWSGKSELCAQIGAGIFSHTYPVAGMLPDRPLRIWVISDPMVFFATTQPRMRAYLPRGWIKRAIVESAWGCDKYWEGQDGGYIRFISWDKKRESFEGAEIDVALFDEPPPPVIQSAVRSRLRGSIKREYYFFTPLAAASSLHDEFEGNIDRTKVGLYKMPIWCNCKCLAGLPVEKLQRLGLPAEISMAKHADNCRCCGGYKTRGEIEEYLSQFIGMELEAREWGEWLYLHRRIFPSFSRERHVLTKRWMIDNWGGYFPREGSLRVVLDPHGARPDFIQFWVAMPDESHVLVYELPSFIDGEFKGKYFKDIHNYHRPTAEICRQMVAVMKTINLPVADMIIDPRAGAVTVRDFGHKVVNSFNDSLSDLNWKASSFRTLSSLKDNVESIEDGHRRINDYLNCINRITGKPNMLFSELCENTIWSGENYRRQEDSDDESRTINEKPEELAKDPWDDTRYYLMTNPTYVPSDRIIISKENADYSLIKQYKKEQLDYDFETVYAL